MQSTSDAYKEEQKQQLREQSYVWVYLGIINKQAQASANVISDLQPMSSPSLLFSENPFEAYYGTLEDEMIKADGSCYFPPRDTARYALYQGAVSKDILGPITFKFTGRDGSGEYTDLPIKGLTINFGDYYPTEFIVSNGSDTYTYTNNAPGTWTCEDVFNDTSYITITPVTMVGGHQRMRILSISFGKGLTFDNTTLLSTDRTNTISHLSSSLPSKKFNFKVSNLDKKFAQDDPNSFIHYLQEKQEVDFEYGRDIVTYDDDGNVVSSYIYRIPGGKTALKDWSSDDQKATFSTVGYLDYSTDKYYKGEYSEAGVSAYDLAKAVILDAGYEEYYIDSYLKKITLHNPLPLDTHRNCLQLIANATKSILYEDRDGRVRIESSFTPEITSITFGGATEWSDAESLVANNTIKTFGTLEADYTHADATQSFLPVDKTSLKATGFVSAQAANDYGLFTTPFYLTDEDGNFLEDEDGNTIMGEENDTESLPTIDIYFEAQWTFYNMIFNFDTVVPVEMEVFGYADGVLVTDRKFTDITLDYTAIQEFENVDHVIIKFNKGEPFQRIHLKHLRFGKETDLTITYTDMSASPTAASLDIVKTIENHWYDYTLESATNQVATTTAKVGDNIVTFSTPYANYSAEYSDGTSGTLTVVESGTYYVKINATAAGKVKISGQKYTVTDNTYDYALNETGITKTVKNSLIDSVELADTQAEWVGEYYNYDTEYSISYRGEPAIDADDQVYIENNYTEENLIRVESETLSTSTGMSLKCKLKAKRISYKGAS